MSVKRKFTKQLLVEGKDDQHVVWALCEKFNLDETFEVIDCEGIDILLDQLPVRTKQSGIEVIGIIVDADSDISSRWRTLSSILSSLGYAIPTDIPDEGLIIRQNEKITVGVWIMPNNSLNGMIEDFIKFLVPEDDQLLNIANDSINNIELEELNKYNIIHKSKALIHTWLSWQEDPGTPMGSSITKRYLTTDAQICNTFVNWLRNMFN
jgi:hypothetical protein